MASPARTNYCVAFSENVAKKGIELRFDRVPSEVTRTELKNAGWRWSRFGGCWYARDHPVNRQWANEFIKRSLQTATNPVVSGLCSQPLWRQRLRVGVKLPLLV